MTGLMQTAGAALLTANFVVANAWGAECVNAGDLSALRTAAMQQELMVAALTCHEVGRYNHFVTSHQAELIDSDARLKSFFIGRDPRRGEASYHTFKTELANAASLRSIRESESFCSNAGSKFDLASRQMSLSSFVAEQPVALGASYRPCPDNGRNVPLMADASAAPPARRAKLHDDDADAPDASAADSHSADRFVDTRPPIPRRKPSTADRSDYDDPSGADRRTADEDDVWAPQVEASPGARDRYPSIRGDDDRDGRYASDPHEWHDDRDADEDPDDQ